MKLRSQGEHKPSILLVLFTINNNQFLLFFYFNKSPFYFYALIGDFNKFEIDFWRIPYGIRPNLVKLLYLTRTILSFDWRRILGIIKLWHHCRGTRSWNSWLKLLNFFLLFFKFYFIYFWWPTLLEMTAWPEKVRSDDVSLCIDPLSFWYAILLQECDKYIIGT